jgi:hypothetical protein
MERETGVEPATSSLGSWHSTTELLPLAFILFYLAVLKALRPLYCKSIPSITSIQTMGFDRKMDSKPVWEASPPQFSFTVHFTVHPTTDSTYHTVRPLGRRQSTETRRGQRQGRPRKVGLRVLAFHIAVDGVNALGSLCSEECFSAELSTRIRNYGDVFRSSCGS